MIRLATIFGLAGMALFTALLIYSDAGKVATVLLDAGWGLLWASLFHILPMIANAIAWRSLFVASPVPSRRLLTYVVWLRESVNGLLPVARIGGEVVSYRLLSRAGFHVAPIVASIIADLTLSMVSQFLFTVAGLVMLLLRIDDTAVVWRVTVGLIAFIPMVIGLFVVQRVGIVNIGARLIGALFGNKWGELVGNAARLDRVVSLIYRRWTRVSEAILWQLLGWALGSGEIWLALRFLGHPIDFYDAFLLEAIAQAISSAAFVIPAAIGIQEGGFMLFGSLLGLDPQTALAVGLSRRIRDVVIFVPGLIAWQFGEAQKLVSGRAAE